MITGILALQGDYFAHGRVLDKLGRKYLYVRNPADLAKSDRLIIPGGESTTIRKLAKTIGLWDALKKYDRPIMGTCTGIILLAKKIENPPEEALGKLDITISRNAYGSQIDSFTASGEYLLEKRTIEMVFIRAPKITAVGKDVEIIAKQNGDTVGVVQSNLLGLTFHPELSDYTTLHELFLSLK